MCEGVAGVNGVISPSSGGGGGGGATLTAGYPVQTPSQLATHALPPEHTSAVAPQFAGHLFTYLLTCLLARSRFAPILAAQVLVSAVANQPARGNRAVNRA